MEDKNSFYPIKSKEKKYKPFIFRFREEHFETYKFVGEINIWWDKTCQENGLNPRDEKLEDIGYHLIELGKNALEYVGEENVSSSEIKVIFESDKIIVEVSDQGQGFKNQDDVEYLSSLQYGRGLCEVREYADEFSIETGGKKYAKIKGEKNLVDIGMSDITTGSKITFVKNFG